MLGLKQARACTRTAPNVDPTQLAWGSISAGPSGLAVDHHLCETGYQAGAENGRLEPLKLRRVNRDLLETYLRDDTRRGPAPVRAFTGSAGGAPCGDLVPISLVTNEGRIESV